MTDSLEDPLSDRLLLLMPTLTYRAGAFLKAAERIGVPVAVGTEQPHVLTAVNPGGVLQVDFDDPEGATDRIVEFAAEHPLRAIVSTDDEGVLLAAMASGALGLRHSSLLAVRAARDKYQTRRALQAAGMRVPGFQRFEADDDARLAAEQVSYPCVLKPLRLAGSRGVIRADDPEQFVAAFERLASMLGELRSGTGAKPGAAANQILVEDYIPGFEVAVEGLLIGGELLVLAIFDKPDPLDGPYFEETIYVTPSRHPGQVQAAVIAATLGAVAALDLTEGPIHAEMRVNQAGVWPLEVAPRSIGGYCSRALRFRDEARLEQRILEHALGRSLGSTEPATPAAGVMMIPIPDQGVLCQVRGIEAAERVPAVDLVRIAIPIGGRVVPLPEGSQYLGFIFASGETAEEIEAALRQAHSRLEFVILPPEQAERLDLSDPNRLPLTAQRPEN